MEKVNGVNRQVLSGAEMISEYIIPEDKQNGASVIHDTKFETGSSLKKRKIEHKVLPDDVSKLAMKTLKMGRGQIKKHKGLS